MRHRPDRLIRLEQGGDVDRLGAPPGRCSQSSSRRKSGPASGWFLQHADELRRGGLFELEPPPPVADQAAARARRAGPGQLARHGRVHQRPESVGQGHGTTADASASARFRRPASTIAASADDPGRTPEDEEQAIAAQPRRRRQRQPMGLDLARRQDRLDLDQDRRQILESMIHPCGEGSP